MHSSPINDDDAAAGELVVALVASEGSGGHPWLHSAELNAGPLASRNMADLLQLIGLLHGSHPGLLETVAEQNLASEADMWLGEACAGFADERDYIARLAVAAGPPPGTPGEATTVSALLAQRGALQMIGRSDRFGCALGAAAALMLDWIPIRATLDTAAARLGVTPPPFGMPGEAAVAETLALLSPRERLDRSLAFGARQVLQHHHGLLDLLQTRAGARES